MWEAQNYFPEGDLKVAAHCVPLHEIYKSRLPLQVVESAHKLQMHLHRIIGLYSSPKVQVCLIIAIEWPMVLIEGAHGHQSAIINFNRFHVQILERLFVDDGSLCAQLSKKVRIEQALVGGLISQSRWDDLDLDSPVQSVHKHIFKLIDWLHVWLDDPDAALCLFAHLDDWFWDF